MKSMQLDDHGDHWMSGGKNPYRERLVSSGVTVIDRDVIRDGIDLPPGSIDAITSFDTLEHFHHSPKRLLRQAMEALRPGGYFLLSAPNRLNLRKRIAYPLGIGAWSSITDWYEKTPFRGHVREPSTSDLRYIARDMGLVDVRVFGRNWKGTINKRRGVRALARCADRLLRLRPSLCSDIYLAGRKPTG